LKPTRATVGIGVFLFVLTVVPLPGSSQLRNSLLWFLKGPLSAASKAGSLASDLIHFRRNAKENLSLRKEIAERRFEEFRSRELNLENSRLARLLELKNQASPSLRRKVFARVIARSPLKGDRALLIDKGTRDGIRPNMLVLSDLAVIGKVAAAGPTASKVLLINDPNFRVGVILQRTRQQGILYGLNTASEECRVKYLSLDSQIKPGDLAETAGLGNSVPKGLLIGTVQKVFKAPGQVYQIAVVRPAADLGRVEEILCVE